jgi:hypothetical protein
MARWIGVGVAVVALLTVAPAAGADVTHSTVTAPASGAGFDVDLDAPGVVTVSGTATADDPANDSVDIVCTYSEAPDGSAAALAPTGATGALTPTGPDTGTFSVQVSLDEFDYYTCRLRAIPSGTLPADYRPFTGPVAHVSGHYTVPPSQPPELTDFYQDISGPLGYWDGGSTASCFVFSTYTLDPATLGYGQLFGCAQVSGAAPVGTRAVLQVDGHDAFLPAEATTFGAIADGEPITGFARHLDPASGDVRLSTLEPVVRCADGSTPYPPTCPAWTAAGLSDHSLTVGDHGGRLVRHTDVWTNSGSGARQVDVWYQVAAANTATQWQFPGETAYAPHVAGDHSGAGGAIPTPPAGPASALAADDPAQADYLNPRGSITWSSPPGEIRFTSPNVLYLHYMRSVPAGRASAISLAFATDASQANADALSAAARASMRPSVTIAAPARVTTSTVKVTGFATDDGPVSVSVNARPASVSAAGTWSVIVPLKPGANALVATATDSDGNTARAQRTVTRATSSPPPATPVVPSNQFTLRVKKPKAGAKSIRATLRVPGPGLIRAKLSARGKRLDKARKTVTRARKVTVRLRLGTNALARLHRRHRLRARVTVSFRPIGGTTRTKIRHLTLRAR